MAEDLNWKILLTPDKASWFAMAGECLPVTAEEFDQMWAAAPEEKATGVMFGKPVTFPRRTRAYGLDYTFAGQTSEAANVASAPGHDRYEYWMYHQQLTGVLVNWHDASDGDYIGPHSDNESTLEKGAPILSITFCSHEEHYRRFRFQPKKGHEGRTKTVKLRNGDVLMMGGTCQRTHKHEIMPARKTDAFENAGRRINVTLRRFKDSTITPWPGNKPRLAFDCDQV